MNSDSPGAPTSRHLLFIAETIPVDGIGSAVIFQRHLRRLVDHGWTVHVISHFAAPESPACFWQHTQLPSRQPWWPPVRRHWRPSVWLRTMLERQHLRSTLDALPAQGVVVVTQFWDDISVLAASIAHRRGWPLGVFHHDDEIGWEPDPRLQGYLHWKSARVAATAARIWPVSQKLVAQLPPAAQPKCRVLRPLPGSFGIPAPQWSEVEPRGLRIGYAGKTYGGFQPLLRTLADRLAAHGGTLELITDPENAQKLQKCGIALIDQPSEASTMLAYMGRDPNSPKLSDTEDAFKELAKIRPYIKLFSNNVIQDVASGDICITTGWSGDYNVMKRRAKAAGKDFDIRYATPKGATGLWFTMMGIPKDSKNKEAAHKWINFLLSPEIAAENTNEITYTSAVGAARTLIKPELANDPFLYPSEAQMAEYFAFKPQDTGLLRATNKLWLRYKSGL